MTEQEARDAQQKCIEMATKMHEEANRYLKNIAACLETAIASTPPKGHILDDTGTVRKVLGTLPITADGCVVGWGCKLYEQCEEDDEPIEIDGIHGLLDAENARDCYSTRSAAEAARTAKEKP